MRRISLIIVFSISFLAVIFSQSKKDKPTCVTIFTTEGDITVELYDDTPLHKENFLRLVQDKSYEGLLFHRVIKNFMIQAGDPDSKNADSSKELGAGSLGYNIPSEIMFPQHYHKRGSLAAARTSDNVNPQKESSASQFYIVTGSVFNDTQLDRFEQEINKRLLPQMPIKYTDEQRKMYRTFGGTPHLDGNYTIFGEVIKGFDIIDKIQNSQTNKDDRPTKNIVILRMKVIKK